MKDSEFLELLNLYLDHEITAADAVRLEVELSRNPDRRRIYRDYCRMQNACKVFAARLAPESEGATVEELVQIEAARNGRKRPAGFYLAGCAAVAVVAVGILALRPAPMESERQGPGSAQTLLAANPNTGTAARALAEGQSVPMPHGLVSLAEFQITSSLPGRSLVAESLVLSGNAQTKGLRAAASSQSGDVDQLAWIRNFQLVSVHQAPGLQQLRFEATPVTLQPQERQIGATSAAEATVEMTSFRFVK